MKKIRFMPSSAVLFIAGAALIFTGACSRGNAAHTEHGEEAEGAHAAETAGAHAGHAGESGAVKLTDAQLHEYGIETVTAGPGEIETQASFPGEILLNADRTVRVVPRVGGIVKDVKKTLGDRVRAGEVLAVVESRELAETAADYLSCRERSALAQTVFDREDGLRKKDISSEQEFLDARVGLAEARIQERAAMQKLTALGLSEQDIRALEEKGGGSAMRYEITSPRAGTIIERHLTVGDKLTEDAAVFTVADMETVWADFNVFQKDLPLVREGQKMTVTAGQGIPDTEGTILYVGRVLDTEKRTALARVLIPNRDGRWRPGLFVTGIVEISRAKVPVRVPLDAVQVLEGKPVVFVRDEDGFEPRPVVTGAKDHTGIEVVEGVQPGDEYASAGAFQLKARIVTSSLGAHAGHNH